MQIFTRGFLQARELRIPSSWLVDFLGRYSTYLPKVFSFGDLLVVRAPCEGRLRAGQLLEDALREGRHLDAVLHENGVDLGLQVANPAQEFDKMALGILRVDRPSIW